MPVKATPRFLILLFTVSTILGILFVTSFRRQPIGVRDPNKGTRYEVGNTQAALRNTGSIMPRLGNETAKAELGRATWKYFHTVLARYPEQPTMDERGALADYIHLFQRLYPCGECADHFGEILKKYPPQVSSRSAAATWGCHVHNVVNESLKKDIFDCANIGEFYDCGCADDEDKTKQQATKQHEDVHTHSKTS